MISTYTGKHLKNIVSEEEELKFQNSIGGGGREGWERKIQTFPLMGPKMSIPICLLIT